MKLVAKNLIETNVYELEIRVEGDDYKSAFEKSFSKNSKNLNIPGFRKGKAPRAMVMKMVGEEYFYDDAINGTYQEAYKAALDESGLEPVDRADVQIKECTTEGYTFVAKIVVKPEVTVKDYKGLEVSRPSTEVTETEVEDEIKRMADRNSRLVEVEDRAAKDGDTANINFEGFVDDVAFPGGKGENYDLVLGSNQFIPGFEGQIVDKKIGEEFDVNVSFPEEYHAEELKGKAAVFKVKLNSLKVRELPEIDDEFAKDVSEFDTLEQLKADIKEKAEERKLKQADAQVENELCEGAAKNMEAVIPQAMIDRKVDEKVQEFGYRLQSQGMNLDDYIKYTGASMDDFRKNFAEQAESEVKVSLTLEKIAEVEKIEVSAEEIAAEYERAATTYNIEVDRVKTFIAEENIVESLKMNKAVDFVKQNAVITQL